MCFIAICVKVTSQLSLDSIHVMFVTFRSLLATASKRNTREFSVTYLHGDDLLSVLFVSISVQVASQFSLESSHLILVAFQSPFVIGLLQTTQKRRKETFRRSWAANAVTWSQQVERCLYLTSFLNSSDCCCNSCLSLQQQEKRPYFKCS